MGQAERALADEIYIMRAAARSVAVVVLFVVKTRVQGHDDRERGECAGGQAGSRDRLINARKTSQKIRRFSRTRRGERFERARIILHR